MGFHLGFEMFLPLAGGCAVLFCVLGFAWASAMICLVCSAGR